MKFVGNRMAIGTLVGLLSLLASRSSIAQTTDTVEVIGVETVELQLYRTKNPSAVPAAKRETKTRSPGGTGMWIPGFWELRGNRESAPRAGWTWVAGRWATPPEQNARWEPGHWGMLDAWWSWIPGHWVVPGKYGYPPDLTDAKIARLKESQEDQQ